MKISLTLLFIAQFLPQNLAAWPGEEDLACRSIGIDAKAEAKAIVAELKELAKYDLKQPKFEFSFSSNPAYLIDPGPAREYYKRSIVESDAILGRMFWRGLRLALSPAEKFALSVRVPSSTGAYGEAPYPNLPRQSIAQINDRTAKACQREIDIHLTNSFLIDVAKSAYRCALFVAQVQGIPRLVCRILIKGAARGGVLTAEEAIRVATREVHWRELVRWTGRIMGGMFQRAKMDTFESVEQVSKYWPLALMSYIGFKYIHPFFSTGEQLIEQEPYRKANEFFKSELEAHYQWARQQMDQNDALPIESKLAVWKYLYRKFESGLQKIPREGREVEIRYIRNSALIYFQLLIQTENLIVSHKNGLRVIRYQMENTGRSPNPDDKLTLEEAPRMIRFMREMQYRVLQQWAYYWAMFPEIEPEIFEQMKHFGFFTFGKRYADVLSADIAIFKNAKGSEAIELLKSNTNAMDTQINEGLSSHP